MKLKTQGYVFAFGFVSAMALIVIGTQQIAKRFSSTDATIASLPSQRDYLSSASCVVLIAHLNPAT